MSSFLKFELPMSLRWKIHITINAYKVKKKVFAKLHPYKDFHVGTRKRAHESK